MESGQLRDLSPPSEDLKTSTYTKGLLGSFHGDKNALSLLALGEETYEEDEAESDNQSVCRLSELKNLYLDVIGALEVYSSMRNLQEQASKRRRRTFLLIQMVLPPYSWQVVSQGADRSLSSAHHQGQQRRGSTGSQKKKRMRRMILGCPGVWQIPGTISLPKPAKPVKKKEAPEDLVDAGEGDSRKEEAAKELKKASVPKESRSDASQELEINEHEKEV